ncbi:MAG TPA: DEAD/DEAH box helicase [Pyrinomonadaceae bacterium]|nr:DEAD/DEAH box helicase [Pyrinomonadaceae bacterium]
MPRFSGGRGGGGRGSGGGRRGRTRDDDPRGSAGARRHDGRGASEQRGRGERPQGPPAAAFNDAIERTAARAARQRPVRELLEGIGTPAPAPFRPDPFQLEALAAVERDDVLVTAPTGSGKTWIAREEIRRLLDAGKRAWYTSPLKALTNSKYHEFSEAFGAEAVGILTGDRKENSDAPLVVGTTEVYRNQLFDAMREGRDLRADLVILDEAHYLSDEDRGHVWEEAIILTPPRVRLLMLSATVGNAGEFAAWIEEVRGVNCSVVARPGARPVPLRAAFLYPDGQLAPLLDQSGRLNHEISNYLMHANARGQQHPRFGEQRRDERRSTRMNIPEMPPGSLLAALGAYDLLPAIVFLPTRRRCDESAAEAALGRRSDNERREARRALLKELAERQPEIRKHRHWDITVRAGVASHHAGHLPAWKLAVEKLMAAGLLDAIFATATVAAGVDFPARTVAVTNMDARTGRGWRPLSASEFQQMTGRAGRRGRDRVGFVVAAPGMHQEPQRMATLLQSPPDPLESQFRATYTTLLNLLDAYGGFAGVRETAARSFAHRDTLERIAAVERERDAAERRIAEKLRAAGCDLPPSVARGLERLASARDRLLTGAPQTNFEVFLAWLDEVVVPGRVVGIGRGSKRLVFVTERREGAFSGQREDGRRATYTLDRIGRVFSEIYPRTENARDAAFADVHARRVPALDEPRLRDARAHSDEAVALINDLMDELSAPARRGSKGPTAGRRGEIGLTEEQRTACEEALWSVVGEAATVEQLGRRVEVLRGEVWQPFERRARVLSHFGYLEFERERVTERGRWLADLRVDRPLLVGEAIERNLFASLDAPRAAALAAALAADAERDYGQLELDDSLVQTLAAFERIAYEVGSAEWQQGIEPAPEINFSAAAAAARWARGASWETLVRETRAEEGDLFRMLSRTGESLLQISNLRESQPRAARVAAEAAGAVLREPVRSEDVL